MSRVVVAIVVVSVSVNILISVVTVVVVERCTKINFFKVQLWLVRMLCHHQPQKNNCLFVFISLTSSYTATTISPAPPPSYTSMMHPTAIRTAAALSTTNMGPNDNVRGFRQIHLELVCTFIFIIILC